MESGVGELGEEFPSTMDNGSMGKQMSSVTKSLSSSKGSSSKQNNNS